MKKSKFLKILAPIVALGLLIGAFFTVSASATTDEGAADAKAPEIISMNVEYGSELYLYYAVDKGDAEGTPKLQVLSDAEGTEIEYTVTYYTTETVHGKECYVFKTNGVAPKELNKAQYVRAVVGEEASEIKAASVELYLNTRLYKNGFAAKTAADGEDYTRRNLYYQLLKYGNSAQKLLVEGDFEAIGKPGLYFAEGSSELNGSYTAGNYVALKAAAFEGKTFSYWKVEEYSVFGEAIGTKLLGDGYEYVLGRSAVITPVYDAEDTSEVELWDENVIHFNYLPSQLEYGTTLTDGTREITSDPEDESNSALKLIPAGKTYAITYNVNNATIPENANVAVAEFRLWYDGYRSGANSYTAEIYFGEKNSTGKSGHASFIYLTGTQVQAYKATSSSAHSAAVKSSSSALTFREWLDIRIEYRAIEADGTVTPQWMVYINDDLVITYNGMYGTNYQDGTKAIPAATNLNRFQFNLSSSIVSGSVYLDDLSVYYLAE
ncbi:MAG: hypothetical protein IJE25_09555 [Clostridia bacterium]|nr:hypothetical protein [Clostridia bacterium]